MRLALDEAALAVAHGDVPVGAVAVVEGRVVARRHNERELRLDPTAHAEVLALRDAAAALGTWRLGAVTLVVTLEPCAMCAGALVAGRVGRLVFGAADPKAGACGSLYQLCAGPAPQPRAARDERGPRARVPRPPGEVLRPEALKAPEQWRRHRDFIRARKRASSWARPRRAKVGSTRRCTNIPPATEMWMPSVERTVTPSMIDV